MPVSIKVLRCLFWGVLAVFVLAAAAFLSLRYWVLPRVDQWRPQIERHVSDALGARVRIGHIDADWSGLNPRLRLASVRVYEDQQAEPALDLPSVSAVVAWRSLARLSPRLLDLRVDEADLTVRRDPEGRIWVAGQSIDPDEPSDGRSPALRWLLAQRQVVLYHATLRWQDQQRQAPELVLSDLDVLLRNGALSHRFGIHARTPGDLAAGFSLRGEFNRHLFSRDGGNPLRWDGQVYVQLDDAQPSAWQPWVSLPARPDGRMAARAWLRMSHGQVQDVTLDTVLRGMRWQGPENGGGAIAARAVRARLQGAPGDLFQFEDVPLARSKDAAGLALNTEIEGLRIDAPRVFETPGLAFDQAQIDGRVLQRPGQPRTLELRQARAVNPDVDARLQGTWHEDGRAPAGIADLRGSLARASMPAIHRYLPLSVSEDARRWLARGLVAGEVRDAAVTLRGDLTDFPFGRQGSTGEFRIAGAYRDAVVDYAPAEGRRKGWPRLEKLHGGFAIDKASLTLDTRDGQVPTGPGQVVGLGAVQASIPDLEHDAELSVTGASEGPAPAYLALAANSPLGGLLDGVLAEAQGTGVWQVPLKLRIPLANVDDARVEGHVGFTGGDFQLMPQIPRFTQLHGELGFTERGLEARDLRATFLGGPARVSGGMGNGRALNFAGTLSAAGLSELSRSPGLQRLSGKTDYQGRLTYSKGADLDVSVQSELTGMAIDLPAPVGKRAETALPLRLQFSPATDRGPEGRRWLSGGLGEDINLLLERDPSTRGGGPYFGRGALGVGRAATLPTQGLSVSGSFDTLDLDGWNDAAEAFAAEPPPAEARRARARAAAAQGTQSASQGTQSATQAAQSAGKAPMQPAGRREPGAPDAAESGLMPPLNQISLSAKRLQASGHTLDQLTLYAQRPTPAQWRVNLDARQAAGTLEWTEAQGAVAGKVLARFSRLALGGEQGIGTGDESGGGQGQDADSGSELSDIPAIDVQAKQFTLYGHDVGSLEVLGTNLERGNLWRLDRLRIASDSATLDAKGQWRLSGGDRGLTVDTKASFQDLGKFLARVGHEGTISDGAGTVDGRIAWRNFPWRHDVADLEGGLAVSLDKGRFLNLNSRTARLLEVLSLQSLQRLIKLDVNPIDVLREGFPFDTVRGNMKIGGGVVTTDGYKINGPVAAVSLEGKADLVAERWDMRAVVVPNLDASGAAVVTALAVNPLVGLGAFVTQWLLKEPLAEAMSVRYRVTGPFDDPKVESVDSDGTRTTPSPAAPQQPWPQQRGDGWVEP
ncbi:YhdP family protein [Bordetella genomosp. 13]|uniref:YhdP family protein n=1 Tax=Bordetella genomosp. 13 TaxID=463040 RepID=UPI0011A07123|nr:YhdP family protein [Bordetella genomosp. 13]